MKSFLPAAVFLVLLSCRAAAQTLTITDENYRAVTRGGVVTGGWSSTADAAAPAVTIRTARPVTFLNAVFRGRGVLVNIAAQHGQVTLRGCTLIGLNPDIRGQAVGRAILAQLPDHLVVERCRFENTGGIGIQGDGTVNGVVSIQENSAHNIDGRLSDGQSGWLDDSAGNGHITTQFVGIDHARFTRSEIAWNQVINDPGQSRVEDNINILNGGGTPGSPLLIHDNYIQGAYGGNPLSGYYAGSGINAADGGILDHIGTNGALGTATAYVHAYNNQVVGTENYGIGINAGHDNEADHNRVVSCGMLPGGAPYQKANLGNMVGVQVLNVYHTGAFYVNSVHDNVVGLRRPDGTRADYSLADAAKSFANRSVPGPITLATEKAEYTRWRWKLRRNHIPLPD